VVVRNFSSTIGFDVEVELVCDDNECCGVADEGVAFIGGGDMGNKCGKQWRRGSKGRCCGHTHIGYPMLVYLVWPIIEVAQHDDLTS
jgi:hypothetical protein